MATRVKPRTAKSRRTTRTPRRRTAAQVSEHRDPARVIYLYGITRVVPQDLDAGEGVDGSAPVEPIKSGGMVCWISRVSRGEFADRLSENMENLEWLASAGVRHQRAVGAIAAATDVLPARFGTVFLSEAGLHDDVQSRKGVLAKALERITGTEEWGVKVFAGERPRVPTVAAKSGRDYLQSKAKLLQPRTARLPDEEIQSLARKLQRITIDSALTGKVSGGQRGLEWQASFLVRRNRRKQFHEVLKRFASRWRDTRRIECTGPWPPYSFVSSDGR
jgi:hypothetical protein